jgi:FkbM family methyltransferase
MGFKKKIKEACKSTLNLIIRGVNKSWIGEYLENSLIDFAMSNTFNIPHKGVNYQFSAPNALTRWRYKTFSEKEPETLKWIDGMNKEAIFWDIGANIGLYSIYAARRRNCKVWAFEPSVFNLEILARNIYLNNLNNNICIVPNPLSDTTGSNSMKMTTTRWGGALSTYGENFGWDGKKIEEIFKFRTIGITMDCALKFFKIPQPEYIKIDVDGIEHLILQGASNILTKVKEVLIEINDDFTQQSHQCRQLLVTAGLTMIEKTHNEETANSTMGFQNTYNQIWIRK